MRLRKSAGVKPVSTPKHLDWQIGEDTWKQPETDPPPRRAPARPPWLLIALGIILLWSWWRVIRPADDQQTSPTPTVAAPVISITSAPRVIANPPPTKPASSRLYWIQQTEKGTNSLVVSNSLAGNVIRRLPVGNAAQFTLSPDGSRLYVADFTSAGGAQGRLRLFDTRSWTMLRQTELLNRVRLPRNAGPPALIMAPDGAALYAQRSVSQTFAIDQLDPTTGEQIIPSVVGPLTNEAGCTGARFVFAAPDGRWLYDLCRNGLMHFNDVQRRTVSRSLSLSLGQSQASASPTVAGAVMSADGQFVIAVSEDGIVSEVDLAGGRVASEVRLPLQAGHRVMPFQVAQIDTPPTLVLGLSHGSEADAGLASEIWFYNLEARALQNQWLVDPPFANLAVSPDLWDTVNPLSSALVRSNDHVLVTSDPYSQQIVIYDLATGQKLRTLADVGSAWSRLVMAPAPRVVEPDAGRSHEWLYLVDRESEGHSASVHVLDADRKEQRLVLTATLEGWIDAAVTHQGNRLWLLDARAEPGVGSLHLVDAASGAELSRTPAPLLPIQPAPGDWLPLISSGFDDNVFVQRAVPISDSVQIENYLANPAGVRRQEEPPFWYKTPLCGPSHLVVRHAPRQLLALCQVDNQAARLTVLSPDNYLQAPWLDLPALLRVRSAVLSPDESVLYVLADGPAVLPVHLDGLRAEAPVFLAMFDVVGRPRGQPALNSDGSILYFAVTFPPGPIDFNALLGSIWVVDTQNWRLKVRMGAERMFIDLGLSQDDQRLYALEGRAAGQPAPTHDVYIFDTLRNVLIGQIPGAVHDPIRLIVAPAPP